MKVLIIILLYFYIFFYTLEMLYDLIFTLDILILWRIFLVLP